MDAAFEAIRTDPRMLRLVGELDMSTVPVLDAAFDSMAAEGEITLDLSGLSFIDSHGLHALARHANGLNGRGPLVLMNVPNACRRLLDLVDFGSHAAISIK